jgi:hypothetical protein
MLRVVIFTGGDSRDMDGVEVDNIGDGRGWGVGEDDDDLDGKSGRWLGESGCGVEGVLDDGVKGASG